MEGKGEGRWEIGEGEGRGEVRGDMRRWREEEKSEGAG